MHSKIARMAEYHHWTLSVKAHEQGVQNWRKKAHLHCVSNGQRAKYICQKHTHIHSPRPRWHSKTFDISRTGMDDWLTCCQWIRMWFHFIFCKYATRVYFWIEARRKRKKRILFFGMNAHCRTLINSVINHRRVGLYVKKRQLTDSLSHSVTPFLWKKCNVLIRYRWIWLWAGRKGVYLESKARTSK